MERALDYLSAQQGRDGAWRDFDTLAGPSDEWVTAYVANALAPLANAREAIERGWAFLWRSRRFTYGWGYNRRVPPDADSTSWSYRLGAFLGEGRRYRLRRAERFVRRHVCSLGGVGTYAAAHSIRLFTHLSSRQSFAGWCGSHLCVTAAVAGCFEGWDDVLAYLLHQQRSQGFWPAYWWKTPEYATALAVYALDRADRAAHTAAIQRAAKWVNDCESAAPARDPFVAALRMRVLVRARLTQQASANLDALAAFLTRSQQQDGSWAPHACLRIPPPDIVDPDSYTHWTIGGRGGGSILSDPASLFTTATVLTALFEAIDLRPWNSQLRRIH
jgi:hypothetical protein